MEEARNDSSLAVAKKLRAKRRLFWKHKEIKRKVHFATLMDICHLKNAELEPKYEKLHRPGSAPK